MIQSSYKVFFNFYVYISILNPMNIRLEVGSVVEEFKIRLGSKLKHHWTLKKVIYGHMNEFVTKVDT